MKTTTGEAVLPLLRLREMVRSVAYLPEKTVNPRPAMRAVHLFIEAGVLHVAATDGYMLAWNTERVDAGDRASVGVRVQELQEALLGVARAIRVHDDVTLSIADNFVALTAKGAMAQEVQCISPRWDAYRSLITKAAGARPAASARVVCKDLAGAVTKAGLMKNSENIVFDFERGDDTARPWIDVQQRTVVTLANYAGSQTHWSALATLGPAERGPAFREDAPRLRIGVPAHCIVNALKNAGKSAVIHLMADFPSETYGGVQVNGDNGSVHAIMPTMPKHIQ